MRDPWWEVRAKGLCICANLLTFIAEEGKIKIKIEISLRVY